MSTYTKQWHPPINSIQTFETFNRLSTFDIDSKKILKLIQALNSNKAHEQDSISVRILKLCGPSVIKLLSLLFNNCLRDKGFFRQLEKNKCYSSA